MQGQKLSPRGTSRKETEKQVYGWLIEKAPDFRGFYFMELFIILIMYECSSFYYIIST